VLLEQIENCTRTQSYDRMSHSTRRAEDLILTLDTTLQGFLQRTRETGDPLTFRPALVDLADVIRDAARQNGPMAESRDIVVKCSRLRPIVVNGDKRLLIEAVDNLIGNAIKDGPKASPVTCSVSVRNRDAVIAITDAGRGFALDDVKRAFQPFAGFSSSFKNRGSSWGTGLWIVRLIAERHGGFVDAVPASRDRSGTTFEIHLPFELM
jgi:signal transduction histidine kinase